MSEDRLPTAACFLALMLVSASFTVGASAAQRPNIVLIMADDLGMECVQAYGGRSYQTPHIDRLAREGMRFTRCFANPYCSPSRAQLLTGRYPLHNGMRRVIYDPQRHREFLDPKQETGFANLLKSAGYKTAMAGKWQVSFLYERDTVRDFGFDEYQCWKIVDSAGTRNSRFAAPVFVRNGKTLEEELAGKYGPNVNAEFLIDFMRRNKERPFLVYYAMLLPHFPWEPTPHSDEPLKKSPTRMGDPKYFPDMVAYMDHLVGRIVKAVDDLSLSDNTIILFTADNGTQRGLKSKWSDGQTTRTIVGGKGMLTDAGTHVPLVVRWPKHIKPGAKCEELVDLSDFLPTFVELVRAKLPEKRINGRSFLPQLLGKSSEPRQWVHIQDKGRRYVRSKRFMLFSDGKFLRVTPPGGKAEKVTGPLSADVQAEKAMLKQALKAAAFE